MDKDLQNPKNFMMQSVRNETNYSNEDVRTLNF